MARDYSTNRYKDKIKKIQQQKRTAADKRKSVADLKREVSSNKKIDARNRKNKANEAFGKRVEKLLDLFTPKRKTRTLTNTQRAALSRISNKPSSNKAMKFKEAATTRKAKSLTNAERAALSRIGSVTDTIPMDLTDTARRKKLAKLAETRAMAEARVGKRKVRKSSPSGKASKGVGSGKQGGRAGSQSAGAAKAREALREDVWYGHSGKGRAKRSKPSAEAQDRKNIKPIPKRIKPSAEAQDRKDIKPKAKTLTEAQKKAIRDTKQVTVKSGDTLTAIAKRHGTTVANLKKINPSIKDLNKIKPGQKIRVGGSDAYEKRIGQVSKTPNRPRTIAQAQKMGSKYFWDSKGNRKIAVTAEQLKKSGLTLSQWLKKK